MDAPIRVAQVMGYMVGGGVEQVVMNYYRHIDRSRVQFDFLVCKGSGIVPCEEIESMGGRVFMVSPTSSSSVSCARWSSCSVPWIIVYCHVLQFMKMLLGQMSVMSPGSPFPREVEQRDARAMQRLVVRPVLTSPWRVGGRLDVDFDDTVRLDLGCIARRSVRTDLLIILQAIAVVFTGKGAH